MPIFILDIIGWIVAHWRLILPYALALVLIVAFGIYWSCGRSTPKLDEAQIQRNQEAVRSGEQKRMEEAYVESKVAEKKIDANRADAELQTMKAKQAAREEARGKTNEQLAAELEALK